MSVGSAVPDSGMSRFEVRLLDNAGRLLRSYVRELMVR